MTLRIAMLAGEASGDILGSRLLVALKQQFGDVQAEGVGGPLMQAEGFTSLYPMERLSVMGLVEPLKRLPELLRMRGALYRHFRDNPPDIFLGIDAPDFNLRLEMKLRRQGIKTAHLVSPSVWAWRQGRVAKIERAVDLMLCLFPFETEIYRQHGVPVAFVGHPLADEIPLRSDTAAARSALNLSPPGKLVALLPGSRSGELGYLAPLFLQAAQLLHSQNPELSFIVPAANEMRYRELSQVLQAYPSLPVTLVQGQSREVMTAADAIVLASGTATLEALLLKRPMVVAYRMATLSWAIISRIVTTEFAALPNVLAGRAVVPELLQGAATPQAIAATVQPLLDGGAEHNEQLREFDAVHEQLRLGSSERTAQALAALLTSPGG